MLLNKPMKHFEDRSTRHGSLRFSGDSRRLQCLKEPLTSAETTGPKAKTKPSRTGLLLLRGGV
jgi:hypothetical protein